MVWRQLRRDFARVLSNSTKRAKNKSLHPASVRIHRAVCEALEQRLLLSTYTVTNTLDDGSTGSLRWAINQSNADTAATNVINFNIAPSGVQTINLLSALPVITQAVNIDATTEGGYTGTPLVELDGTAAGGVDGLYIQASNSSVEGLAIVDFNADAGIYVNGASGVTIAGNYVGVRADGTTAGGNYYGIFIDSGSQNVTIGGTTDAARNLICYSAATGITIAGTTTGTNTSDITVEGNYIGTANGFTAAANETGVAIYGGAQNNTIGSTTFAGQNVISGNTYDGILIEGTTSGPQSNIIEGNLIGTNYDGDGALENDEGVVIESGAQDNTVGGTAAGAGNIISGNAENQVEIIGVTSGPQTTGNVVEGNLIGPSDGGLFGLGSATANGVLIEDGAQDNTVGGTTAAARNVISGQYVGVNIDGTSSGPQTSGNTVEGNYIGTDPSGSIAVAGAVAGVIIEGGAEYNTIGGTTAGARNVISGNAYGLYIQTALTNFNTVEGNYIGTDSSGTFALGNTNNGVGIVAGSQDNTIGGTAAGAGNVISANGADGIAIIGQPTGAQTTGNLIQGNDIGTDYTGTKILPNASDGVDIDDGASHNTIGGAVPGAGNVISGNAADGVSISGAAVLQNIVAGNDIGTDPTGTIDLGNGEWGVDLDDGAEDNFIGGTTTASANVIAFNGDGGVGLNEEFTFSDPIRFNFIYDNNTGIGIDLGEDGVTPNDPGDTDPGPDNLQNTPALAAATNTSTATVVTGTFNSNANTTFFIDFYSSNAVNANGSAQARGYVTTFTVTTDASGNATLNLTLPSILAPGTYLTAAATTTSYYPYGDTSELAFPIQVVGLPPPPPPTLLTPSINITADGTYTGLPQPASATVTGTGNAVIGTATLTYYAGSSATGTPLSGPPTNVGTYTVLASFGGSPTYSAFSATDTFHITPAPLVITANNQSRAEGASNPPLTVGYQGFVNGEGPSVLTTQPTVTTTATTSSPPGPYAITASGAAAANYSITYVPGTLTVTPPVATKLVFTRGPSNGTAGQKLSEIDVSIEDQNGNVVAGDSSIVTLSINSGPGGFASGSTLSVHAVNGVAKFTNLTLDTAGQYTLKASDSTDGISAISSKFTIACAAACKVVCMQGPTGGTAGSNCGTTSFCIEDAYGNVETANNSTVTLTIHSGPGSFTSTSTTSVKAVNGVAKFTSLVLDKSGSYTVCATQGSMSCNSSAFTIAAAAATHMIYSVLPASPSHGNKGTVQVELLDQYGNLCTNNSSTVKISLGSGPSGASLGGTLSEAVINGIATFSLSFSAAGNYTLLAHDSNGLLPTVTSGTVRVS